MKTHKHKAIDSLTVEKGYSHPAPGAKRQVPQAYGCIALHQTCSCGAKRVTNVNQWWREVGAWIG